MTSTSPKGYGSSSEIPRPSTYSDTFMQQAGKEVRRARQSRGCLKPLSECQYDAQGCSKTAHKAYRRAGSKSWGMKRAETVTVDEETRMRLNGETPEMMAHVKKRWKDKCIDTSVDSEWVTDGNLKCRDTYVWIITLLWLTPKILAFVFPMLFLYILTTIPPYAYARSFPAGTDKIERTCGFWVVYTVTFMVHFPNLILIFVCLTLDYIMYYIGGFIWTLCTCRWKQCWASHRALDPYRNGPSLLWHGGPDIFACVAGDVNFVSIL